MNTKTEISENMKEKTELFGVKLEVLSGPMDGLEFEIKNDMVTIGREQDKDISLPLDIMISRSHARITHENGEYWLEDMGSRNGTWIFVENEKWQRQDRKVQIFVEKTIFKLGVTEMRLYKS